MDQLTHTVRRSNWINIIRQCQDRPAGTTAKQWLAENDISEKSYYYWLRKIRREVCEQEGLQEVTNPSDLSFVEIPVKTALDTAPVPRCRQDLCAKLFAGSVNITVQMYPCSEGTDTGNPVL